MNESQKHKDKQNNLDTKECKPFDWIFMTFWERQNSKTRNQCEGSELERETLLQRNRSGHFNFDRNGPFSDI